MSGQMQFVFCKYICGETFRLCLGFTWWDSIATKKKARLFTLDVRSLHPLVCLRRFLFVLGWRSALNLA